MWNRTAPFWTHRSLVPLDEVHVRCPIQPTHAPTEAQSTANAMGEGNDESGEEEEEENGGLVDMAADGYDTARETFAKQMRSHVELIHAFCDGLEYQIQFGDHHFLKVLERDGAGFLRLAENCITQE